MAKQPKKPRLRFVNNRWQIVWYDGEKKRHRVLAPKGFTEDQAREWATQTLAKQSMFKRAVEFRLALEIRKTKGRFGDTAHRLYSAAIKRYEKAGCCIDRFVEHAKSDGLSQTTLSSYLSALKAIGKRAFEYGLIKEAPFLSIKIPKPDSKPKPTASETDRVRLLEHIKATDTELYHFCALVHYAFIRMAEIVRLQPTDYDFNARIITVRGSCSKSGKTNPVYMIDSLFQILNGKAPRFTSNANCYAYRFKKIAREMGIDCTLYSLKHSGVRLAYYSGATHIDLMQQCRHASFDTTMVYLRSIGAVSPSMRRVNF